VTTRRAVVAAAVGGVLGVVAYVGAWAAGGVVWDGYDPMRQAISELFAIGAPTATRLPLSVGLVASGLGLVAFGWAMDVALPGRGRLGPALAVVSGVMTVAVVAFPCTAGCPGVGATTTDTLHVVTAGTGYVALMAAPMAVAHRVRHALPRLATAGWVLGGGALLLFVSRTVGLTPGLPGLQQRVFNTAADAWYVLAAVAVVRAARVRDVDRPTPTRA
jgi:hypothetical protein